MLYMAGVISFWVHSCSLMNLMFSSIMELLTPVNLINAVVEETALGHKRAKLRSQN